VFLQLICLGRVFAEKTTWAGHAGDVSAGARLYVDNELLDVTNALYANEDEATLVGVCGEEDEFRIEVSL
jgi:hypothetical protein